jgi:hypothetical protein
MIERRSRFLALTAVLAAAALAAAGCGSGDDATTPDAGTTAAAASLTMAEFVTEGNEICAEVNEELEAGIEEFAEENGLSGNDQPSEEQLEELATEILIPSVAGQFEQIRGLGAPSGEEKKVDAFLDKAESAVEEVEADPALITDQAGQSPFVTVSREATALGLVACGEEI